MTIHWKAVEQYFTVLLFDFTQFVILENLSVLDLALSGVEGLRVCLHGGSVSILLGYPGFTSKILQAALRYRPDQLHKLGNLICLRSSANHRSSCPGSANSP